MVRLVPVVALVAAAGLLGGCYSDTASVLTSKGLSRPELELRFPTEVSAGSVEEAVLTVTNPGPGDMSSVVVAFAALGKPDPGTGNLPPGLVRISSGGSNPAIESIDPDPVAVSRDGVLYRFNGLSEGASMTITFELAIPDRLGRVANSIQVYDGNDLERARGLALDTEVVP